MANKKTRPFTREEFELVIATIKQGFTTADGRHIRPNIPIATALILEANLGLRIGDITRLKLSSIVYESGKYHLDIVEQKTGKKREFTVATEVYIFIQSYALARGIPPNGRLFSICTRTISNHLKMVCDHLGLKNCASHSLRKFFAVSIFTANGKDAILVQTLLNHSSLQVTQHYLSVEPEQVENALKNHVVLPA